LFNIIDFLSQKLILEKGAAFLQAGRLLLWM